MRREHRPDVAVELEESPSPMSGWFSKAVASLRSSSALALLVGLLVYALWPWLPGHARAAAPRTIVFYGFSILEHAVSQDVFPDAERSEEHTSELQSQF